MTRTGSAAVRNLSPAAARPAGNVVVGVDGSPASRAALHWAMREAELFGTGLTLCHVHPLTGLAGTRPLSVSFGEDTLALAAATAERHLGESRVAAVLAHGDTARALARLTDGARMLVLGAHGYFGHAGRAFPPTALRVIAGAHCPVVVHSQLAGAHGAFAGHVVIGVDGSAAASAALELGFAHAEARGKPVAAITVSEEPVDYWTDDELLETHFVTEPPAEAMLAAEVEPLEARYPKVPVKRAVFGGPIVPALLRAAAGADLLVIGDRGRGHTPRVLLGFVAEHMVASATSPVAVVKSPARPQGS